MEETGGVPRWKPMKEIVWHAQELEAGWRVRAQVKQNLKPGRSAKTRFYRLDRTGAEPQALGDFLDSPRFVFLKTAICFSGHAS